MGPYCRFCDRRCFIPLPANTPPEALDAYGTSTIVATCPAGQAFELNRTGWNLDRIRAAPTPAAATPAPAGEADDPTRRHLKRVEEVRRAAESYTLIPPPLTYTQFPPQIPRSTSDPALLAIRMGDELWSRDVQDGRVPFAPDVARCIHAAYSLWMKVYGAMLPDEHNDVLWVRSVLATDVEDLIESMRQSEAGETVPLEEAFAYASVPPAPARQDAAAEKGDGK